MTSTGRVHRLLFDHVKSSSIGINEGELRDLRIVDSDITGMGFAAAKVHGAA